MKLMPLKDSSESDLGKLMKKRLMELVYTPLHGMIGRLKKSGVNNKRVVMIGKRMFQFSSKSLFQVIKEKKKKSNRTILEFCKEVLEYVVTL